MKYYKIKLIGRGAEVYPFKINNEQYEIFRNSGVEQDELSHDEISEILGVDTYFDCPNETLMGVYPMSFKMTVEDTEGNIVYETETLDSDKCDFEEIYCDEEDKYLLIEDNFKGTAIEYDIPIEDEFDIEKLTFKCFDVGCRVEIITDILYDDKDYNMYKSYGDTIGKGYYFHLITGI